MMVNAESYRQPKHCIFAANTTSMTQWKIDCSDLWITENKELQVCMGFENFWLDGSWIFQENISRVLKILGILQRNLPTQSPL